MQNLQVVSLHTWREGARAVVRILFFPLPAHFTIQKQQQVVLCIVVLQVVVPWQEEKWRAFGDEGRKKPNPVIKSTLGQHFERSNSHFHKKDCESFPFQWWQNKSSRATADSVLFLCRGQGLGSFEQASTGHTDPKKVKTTPSSLSGEHCRNSYSYCYCNRTSCD